MQLSVIFLITLSSGILFSSALLPFQINSIYADESETNTDQSLAQENIGSGESINTNCGENSIGGSAFTDCDGTLPTGEPPFGRGEPITIVVQNCRAAERGEVVCDVIAPPDFAESQITCDPFGGCVAEFIMDDRVAFESLICNPPPEPVLTPPQQLNCIRR